MTIVKLENTPERSVSTADNKPSESRSTVSLFQRMKTARSFWSVIVLAALVAVWQLVTQVWNNAFFPTPMTIFAALPSVLMKTEGSAGTSPLMTDVGTSVTRMAVGFLLGSIVGILVGVLLGWFARAREYVFPIVEFLRSIPATAVLPIFIILLGLGSNMQILFIAYGVTWFVLINTAAGVASMDPALAEYSKAFKISRSKLFFGIVLPNASPQIFAGLRIGLTASMILFVTSEFMGATNGIGYQLIQAQRYFEVVEMWSWMVVIALIGFLANTLLELLESRMLRWHTVSHAV